MVDRAFVKRVCWRVSDPFTSLLEGFRPRTSLLQGFRPLTSLLEGFRPLPSLLEGVRPSHQFAGGFRPPTKLLEVSDPLTSLMLVFRPSHQFAGGFQFRPSHQFAEGFQTPSPVCWKFSYSFTILRKIIIGIKTSLIMVKILTYLSHRNWAVASRPLVTIIDCLHIIFPRININTTWIWPGERSMLRVEHFVGSYQE